MTTDAPTTRQIERIVAELESELAAIDDRRESVEAQLRGWRLILAARKGEPMPDTNAPSFARSVRNALKEMGRTAAPAEVSTLLWERGIRKGDKFNHYGAVSSELNRASARENSPIERVDRGKYRWKG